MSSVRAIWSNEDRDFLCKIIRHARPGTRVEMKEVKRTLGQNTRMWGTLTSISDQVIWHGQRLSSEDWKHLFTAALKRARIIPNLDGDGFVVLGVSTSDMSRDEIDNLQEAIYAFGAERGVKFNDPREAPPDRALPAPARALPAPTDRSYEF